jgi:cytochrome P450
VSIPRLDVFAPNFLRDQDDLLNAARERHPFAVSDRGIEILRYAECQALLRDRRVGKDHMAEIIERLGIVDREIVQYKSRIVVSQGLDANRDRMRAVFSRAASARQINRARTEIRTIIDKILDNVSINETVDFIKQVAALIPSTFSCKWVGLPLRDASFISDLAETIIKIFWLDPSCAGSIQAAYKKLFDYVDCRLDAHRCGPGGTFLLHLMQEQRRGNLEPQEVRDWVVFVLEMSADNTVHQIGLLLGRLLETPELWERIRRSPTLVPAVVEESLRLDAHVRVITMRHATEDIEVPGHKIRAGTDMFFWIRAAHLDPRAFYNPEEFHINRPKTPGPLLFGGGAYSCLGQWIARAEVQETLWAIIDRFPNIRLTGTPQRSIDMFALAAERLPVVLNGKPCPGGGE